MSKAMPLPEAFPVWFARQWKSLFRVPFTPAVAAAIISVALSTISGAPDKIPYLTGYIYGAQLTAIAFLLTFVVYGYEPHEYKTGLRYVLASEAVEQFLFYWKCLWCSWLLLYVALTAQAFGFQVDDDSAASYLVRTMVQLLNNLPAIFCIMLYQIIATRTVNVKKPKYWHDKLIGSLIFWLTTFAAVSIAEIILMFVAGPGHWHDVFKEMGNIYYSASALAVMLLATSLGSIAIDVPRWAFYMLAAYGAIQPMFGFLQHIAKSDDQTTIMRIFQAVAITYALVSKILLFVIVYWLADTRRLHYYMASNRMLLKNAPLRIARWLDKAKTAQLTTKAPS